MSETEDIREALTRALSGQFTLSLQLPLESHHRYILFSDQHKGGGDSADEFRLCRPAYEAALNHYKEEGYTLILLGDVEELWEQGFKSVQREYEQTLQLEGSFGPGRYFRIWGNHDDDWMNDKNVRKRLWPYIPTGAVYEAIRFEVSSDQGLVGTLLLLHGHQGSFASDKIRGIARFFVRIYRHIQRLTGIGKETPAEDDCLRGEHDTRMYEWAVDQNKLVLIAGHTHRPVWTSRTHLQKLEEELRNLELASTANVTPGDLERKREEVQERREKYPPCKDTEKPQPVYFNTGCCKFADGDITGIELENGIIRLVKWHSKPTPGGPTVFEETRIADIYARLP